MTDVVAEGTTAEETKPRRKRGRPRKHPVVESGSEQESRVTRPVRVPVGLPRDKLTVFGKDPNYVYRWVKDAGDCGQRIMQFRRGGYEFVQADDIQVGQDFVHKHSDSTQSIVRFPSGRNEPNIYMYLMRIRKEFYDEDQAAKMRAIDEVESDMFRERDEDRDDGQYGKPKLSFG